LRNATFVVYLAIGEVVLLRVNVKKKVAGAMKR
jgi:hypothetical protein